MKKAIALILFAATVFALAACAKKKGERYEEPPTEVITFGNGSRMIYEVVTDPDGEPETDAEGKKVYRLYDPPLTEKGGYLVTDAEGSTIKRSAATDAAVSIATDIGSAALDSGAEAAVPATDANGQTAAPQTDAEGRTIFSSGSGKTNKNPNNSGEGTTIPQLEHAVTVAAVGTLSRGKAEALLNILDGIENPFDEDLAEDRFFEAKDSILVYIANVQQAQKQIMADPEICEFVTKANLEYWNGYLIQAQRKYDEFIAILGAQTPGEKAGSSVYTSYVAFQTEYRKAREVYYHIYEAAESYVK